MKEIERLLNISDITRIFGLSKVSIYRKIAAARAGKIKFILPVSDCKQRLRFDAAAVEAFIKSKNTPVPQVHVVSPIKEEKKRREGQDAMKTGLARHGIIIENKKGE